MKNLVSFLLAAEAGQDSTTISILKVIGPALVAGIISLLTIYLSRKFSTRDKKDTTKTENYKVDVEQLVKQREFLITENQSLFLALKDELERCRDERNNLDSTIDSMKRRLTKVEGELQAWEMGLKTPPGFRLVKIDEDTKPEKGDDDDGIAGVPAIPK